MRKRFVGLLLLITIAIFAAILTINQGARYSELCISKEELQKITESRKLAEEALYSKLLFNEYELMYDAGRNRLFYSLIENSDSAYDPFVECVSKETSVKIAIVGEAITNESIENGEEFGILIYTDKEYQYVNLVCTTLPLMSIDYDGQMSEEGNVQFRFRLFDNRQDATRRMMDEEGEIRVRGRSSSKFPKQGYRFTLYSNSVGENKRELNTALLGMRQDGDWLLYAAYNDKEKVRNVFSSNLWKVSCAGNNVNEVDNGMEYKYVELFINGEYWGLYALGYPIDKKQLRMTAGEYVYEKENPELSELDIDFTMNGAVEGYTIRELGDNQEECWDPLKKYYQTMFGDDENYSKLREMVDLENHLDIFLFLNLIQGVDHANVRGNNLIFNLYMTNKFYHNGESEAMLYTPWDMDRTWGFGFEEEGDIVTADRNVLMQTNIVYLLLEQDNREMQEMLVQRYQELRESTWSNENILQMLDSYEDDIFNSGAYVRDRSRWPEGSYIEEQTKLSAFKEYVIERLQYMDTYVTQYE